jgi:hypothetical protein
MAYIGKQPAKGNFVKLDTITVTATTTFNLTNGGVAYYPQSANNCLVSLNGILQAPTDSYTISGSTIVFSSALTTSDVIDFIIVLGDVLSLGTVSDATVGIAKLTATGTPSSSTFLRGDNSWASAGTNTPNFFAYATADTTVTDSTETKISLSTTLWDSASAFSTSKFTVPSGQAGKYFFTYGGLLGNFASGNWCEVMLYVNGTRSDPSRCRQFVSTTQSAVVSSSVILNLSVSDYVELYCLQVSGGSKTAYGTSGTYFTHLTGFKLL